MYDTDADILDNQSRPRTATVLVWLVSASMVLSYLIAYAFMGALASADLIERWHGDSDPRPKWLLLTFTSLTGTLTIVWMFARYVSSRQLRRIDEMKDETSEPETD